MGDFSRTVSDDRQLLLLSSCVVLKRSHLQKSVWEVNGCSNGIKCHVLWIKLTNLVAMLYSLLFASVSGHFEAFWRDSDSLILWRNWGWRLFCIGIFCLKRRPLQVACVLPCLSLSSRTWKHQKITENASKLPEMLANNKEYSTATR